jgi:hypothetical protein
VWARSATVAKSSQAVHFAALFHLKNIVERIIVGSVEINERSAFGTPLHCALWGPDALCFTMSSDTSGRRMKTKGATKACHEVVDVLLRHQADVRQTFRVSRGSSEQTITTLFLATLAFATEQILDAGALVDAISVRNILSMVKSWTGEADHWRDRIDVECLSRISLEDVPVSAREAAVELVLLLRQAQMTNEPLPEVHGDTPLQGDHKVIRSAIEEACRCDEPAILE